MAFFFKTLKSKLNKDLKFMYKSYLRNLIILTVVFFISSCGSKKKETNLSFPTPFQSIEKSKIEENTEEKLRENTLKDLPSVDDITSSVKIGRDNPFLPVMKENETNLNFKLVGIIEVGLEKRALIKTPFSNEIICLGNRGKCRDKENAVLPPDWEVKEINNTTKCILISIKKEDQTPVCIGSDGY